MDKKSNIFGKHKTKQITQRINVLTEKTSIIKPPETIRQGKDKISILCPSLLPYINYDSIDSI